VASSKLLTQAACRYVGASLIKGGLILQPYKIYGIGMRFCIHRLRYLGRPLPKRQWTQREPVQGDLRVEQIDDEDLLRQVRIARVVNPNRSVRPDELPPLHDPVIVAMSTQAFNLAGFERIVGADFAQSWLVSARAERRSLALRGTTRHCRAPYTLCRPPMTI
jgi:hypothetical protein